MTRRARWRIRHLHVVRPDEQPPETPPEAPELPAAPAGEAVPYLRPVAPPRRHWYDADWFAGIIVIGLIVAAAVLGKVCGWLGGGFLVGR